MLELYARTGQCSKEQFRNREIKLYQTTGVFTTYTYLLTSNFFFKFLMLPIKVWRVKCIRR